MEEKQLTGHESLSLINEMISKAKHEIKDDGAGWLLWGGMIFFASVATFIIIQFNLKVQLFIAWNVFGLIAIPLLIYGMIQGKKRRGTRTYVDEMLYYFDVGFTICIFIIILSINIARNPGIGFGYFLMVYAFLMLIQGAAIKFRPLFIGAIINWAGAIGIFFCEEFKYDMLITAGAVFAGYIIPGLMLRSQHKKRSQQGLSR
ncbi:MAG TPA: hypothetical protein VD993_12440 [Chitinophagaceae bacterium]|nr:hypothetical protein [Chitinophagaceae bacterium]